MRKSDRLIWSLSRMKSKTEKITEIKSSVTDAGVYRWPATFVPVWLHPRGTNPFVCTGAVKQAHILLVYPPAAPAWIERCHCLRGRRIVLCVYEPDRGKTAEIRDPERTRVAAKPQCWSEPETRQDALLLALVSGEGFLIWVGFILVGDGRI